MAIANCYINQFDAPPPEEWENNERGRGTITMIQLAMKAKVKHGWTPHRSTIRDVLQAVDAAALKGEDYTAARNAGSGGANKLMLPGSFEEQLIADCMEDDLVIRAKCKARTAARVASSAARHQGQQAGGGGGEG